MISYNLYIWKWQPYLFASFATKFEANEALGGIKEINPKQSVWIVPTPVDDIADEIIDKYQEYYDKEIKKEE